jgi:hypothetical protein
MYRYRFDLPTLAQTTGLWQWQIKRHFKPSVFAKLSDKVLKRYAETFGIKIMELKNKNDISR